MPTTNTDNWDHPHNMAVPTQESFQWDRCGPLSQECERFFVQEACFYASWHPWSGARPWRKQHAEVWKSIRTSPGPISSKLTTAWLTCRPGMRSKCGLLPFLVLSPCRRPLGIGIERGLILCLRSTMWLAPLRLASVYTYHHDIAATTMNA